MLAPWSGSQGIRPPQEIEHRQQRQAQDGEVVGVDALEQMDARGLST